jgi:hypothetical protein
MEGGREEGGREEGKKGKKEGSKQAREQAKASDGFCYCHSLIYTKEHFIPKQTQ